MPKHKVHHELEIILINNIIDISSFLKNEVKTQQLLTAIWNKEDLSVIINYIDSKLKSDFEDKNGKRIQHWIFSNFGVQRRLSLELSNRKIAISILSSINTVMEESAGTTNLSTVKKCLYLFERNELNQTKLSPKEHIQLTTLFLCSPKNGYVIFQGLNVSKLTPQENLIHLKKIRDVTI